MSSHGPKLRAIVLVVSVISMPVIISIPLSDTATARTVGNDVVEPGETVFQGERGLQGNFSGTEIGSLQRTAGDNEGILLEDPIPQDQPTGLYTVDGESGSDGVVAQTPRVTTVDIQNGQNQNVNADVLSTDQRAFVAVKYNFEQAERVRIIAEDANGGNVTDQLLAEGQSAAISPATSAAFPANSGINTSRFDVAFEIDPDSVGAGEYTITVEGNDSLDFGVASQSRAVTIASQEQVQTGYVVDEFNISDQTVAPGDEITVTGNVTVLDGEATSTAVVRFEKASGYVGTLTADESVFSNNNTFKIRYRWPENTPEGTYDATWVYIRTTDGDILSIEEEISRQERVVQVESPSSNTSEATAESVAGEAAVPVVNNRAVAGLSHASETTIPVVRATGLSTGEFSVVEYETVPDVPAVEQGSDDSLYLELEGPSPTAQNATIEFRINQTEVSDPDAVAVRRFTDGGAQTLLTQFRGESQDGGSFIFEFSTPGFSFFEVTESQPKSSNDPPVDDGGTGLSGVDDSETIQRTESTPPQIESGGDKITSDPEEEPTAVLERSQSAVSTDEQQSRDSSTSTVDNQTSFALGLAFVVIVIMGVSLFYYRRVAK